MNMALRSALIVCCALLNSFPTSAVAQRTLNNQVPVVIAHRGACGYLPEHTVEAYRAAIEMGADYIEADLVITKDGILIARHEPMLGGSTNVADHPEFAARRTTRSIDGVPVTDWFACDFTLAEIKQLRARQTMVGRSVDKNDQFAIATFQELIDLAKSQTAASGRSIGIYAEVKHSMSHLAMGLPIEDRLLEMLAANGWSTPAAPVIVESFEAASLRYLRSRTGIRMIQLIDGDTVNADGTVPLDKLTRPYDFAIGGDTRTFRDMLTPEGLAEIRTYADGVGPWKPYLIPTRTLDRDSNGVPDDLNGDGESDDRDRETMAATNVVRDAHAAGLFVHTWTLRNDPARIASTYAGDPAREVRALLDLGVDGIFSDFPDTAVSARAARAVSQLQALPK